MASDTRASQTIRLPKVNDSGISKSSGAMSNPPVLWIRITTTLIRLSSRAVRSSCGSAWAEPFSPSCRSIGDSPIFEL